jgi:hypothetical protein
MPSRLSRLPDTTARMYRDCIVERLGLQPSKVWEQSSVVCVLAIVFTSLEVCQDGEGSQRGSREAEGGNGLL